MKRAWGGCDRSFRRYVANYTMIRVLRNALSNFEPGMWFATLLDQGGPRFGVDELALVECVCDSLPGMGPLVSALC